MGGRPNLMLAPGSGHRVSVTEWEPEWARVSQSEPEWARVRAWARAWARAWPEPELDNNYLSFVSVMGLQKATITLHWSLLLDHCMYDMPYSRCTILLYLSSHRPLPSYKFQQSYLHFLGTKNSKSWRFLIIHKLCCMLQIIFFRIRYYSYSIQYPLSRQQILNDKNYTITQYHMEFRLQGIFQL